MTRSDKFFFLLLAYQKLEKKFEMFCYINNSARQSGLFITIASKNKSIIQMKLLPKFSVKTVKISHTFRFSEIKSKSFQNISTSKEICFSNFFLSNVEAIKKN